MTEATQASGGASRASNFSHILLAGGGSREQLLAARDVLDQGLEYVSAARRATARTDGSAIADVSWAKVSSYNLCLLEYTAFKKTRLATHNVLLGLLESMTKY